MYLHKIKFSMIPKPNNEKVLEKKLTRGSKPKDDKANEDNERDNMYVVHTSSCPNHLLVLFQFRLYIHSRIYFQNDHA
jgi:hypothetical protein